MVKVAAIQASPVYLDLDSSLKRALSLIGEAAGLGARLVVFPETWLPGYPAWLDCCRDVAIWDHEPVKRVYARLMENSVVIPGPATDALAAAARDLKVVLNISVHERVKGGAGSRHALQHHSHLRRRRRAAQPPPQADADVHRANGVGRGRRQGLRSVCGGEW